MGGAFFEGGGEDRAAGAEVLEFVPFVPFGGVGEAGSASGLCCCGWEGGFGHENGWGGRMGVRAKAALGAKVVHLGGFYWKGRQVEWSGYECRSGGNSW